MGTLITGLVSYLGTSSDYFIILVLIFATFRQKNQVRPIIIGAYLGNALLVLIAFLVGLTLKQVPAEWLLGLLGLIPIILGVKNFLTEEEEEEGEVFVEKLSQTASHKIVMTVVVMTIASCGADNLALYIPYFSLAGLDLLPIIFAMFFLILTLSMVAAYHLAQVKQIQEVFEKFGDGIQSLVYLILGIYILFEAGTVTHLISLL
ncbi:cadmium resistance transporter [Fructobacillus ficulneus]|uniref:Permease, cadmium resistance protein n=1 Tax=Fructobacillus ficulneus TaxID=157463 RepID=A0A0K8MFH3_9LACO|nr:cadmium resistance transporter [Fructobacillus ficulneus]GAO99260.1 permease, cadmium resistance protein [Fructobacillus ficulneus]